MDDIKEIDARLRKDGITFEGKHVLVTGGAGFLGSWVCDLLIYQGARVVCLDNLSSGCFENIAHLREHSNFTFIQHDISKQRGVTTPQDVLF